MAILSIALTDDCRVARAVGDVGHSHIAISIKDAGVRRVSSDTPMTCNADEVANALRLCLRRRPIPILRPDSATVRTKPAIVFDATSSGKSRVAGAHENL